MTPAVQQFSFLNRWFIFRRKGDIPAEVIEESTSKNIPSSSPTVPASSPTVPASSPTDPASSYTRKQYAASEVLQFYIDAPLMDRLKIADKSSLRWISPGSPFPIYDPTTPTETYPSIEHFLAGMRYKLATDKPGLSQSLFGTSGSIHQKFIRQRAAESGIGVGAKALTEERDSKLLVDELKEIHDSIKLSAMKKWGAKFNESTWKELENNLITEAITQRWTKDARFRTIVEAAKQQGKTLLFYTGSASSIYGGKRTAEGNLEGENKIGKTMMSVAGFT
jgi:hypothetical protein